MNVFRVNHFEERSTCFFKNNYFLFEKVNNYNEYLISDYVTISPRLFLQIIWVRWKINYYHFMGEDAKKCWFNE